MRRRQGMERTFDLDGSKRTVTYAKTESLPATLESVARRDGGDYSSDNWRSRAIGSRGMLHLHCDGYEDGLWRGRMERAIFPGGSTPGEFDYPCFSTGTGAVKLDGPAVRIETSNSVWAFRLLGDDEAGEYEEAWGKRQAEKEAERKKRIEEKEKAALAAKACAEAMESVLGTPRKRENVYRYVETFEDVYWLVDLVLEGREVSLTPDQHRLDRNCLVTFIAMVFEYHCLFEFPYRAETMRTDRELHFCDLAALFGGIKRPDAYDIMIENRFHEGQTWNPEACEWELREGGKPHYNTMAVAHWRQTKGYSEGERKAALERIAELLRHVCGDGYEELCCRAAQSRMERILLDSMML